MLTLSQSPSLGLCGCGMPRTGLETLHLEYPTSTPLLSTLISGNLRSLQSSLAPRHIQYSGSVTLVLTVSPSLDTFGSTESSGNDHGSSHTFLQVSLCLVKMR
ncbi:hypothetical protein GDO86_009490 [Hymenochirus boettgeri]|uniref:Uncharacterized protein n=1 Tax=Hymenochirus boettgeri TaxID=247094 RepID=A0A8T2JJ54_9PIPI|nr:hypothetical protein GDO86_009490 [Hymenochirus boettgeri]